MTGFSEVKDSLENQNTTINYKALTKTFFDDGHIDQGLRVKDVKFECNT